MSLYDTLRAKLSSDLFTQVTDALGDDFNYDLVPRTRLNKVIAQRNELKEQLAGSQSATLTVSEDDDLSAVSLPPKSIQSTGSVAPQDTKAQVEAIKQQLEAEKNSAVRAVKIQFAALDKLREAQAVSPDLIWKAGLIDMAKVTDNEDGTFAGLEEQIAGLQSQEAYKNLFTQASQGAGTGATGNQGAGSNPVTTKAEFLQLPYAQQVAFKAANPEVFSTFMTQ